jgi:hypothetical protein
MLTFTKKTDDRKALVKRLGELTGIKPHYNGMPDCTYTVGAYTIGKDGSLMVEDTDMDQNIINTLVEEDLIEGTELPAAETKEPEEAAEEETEESTETFPIELNIELPLEGHTGISIRNLVSEIYSRAGLLAKAIGSTFTVTEALVKELQQDENTESLEKAIACIKNHAGELAGIEFTDDRIRFTGFPEAEDADEVKAFMDLASLMTKAAREQKRIMAKEVDDSNEKYITRIWLLRLGMKGSDYKTTRAILLKNLSGHIAFRTQEQIDAAKEKAKAKRAAAKAAKQAEEVTSDAVSE